MQGFHGAGGDGTTSKARGETKGSISRTLQVRKGREEVRGERDRQRERERQRETEREKRQTERAREREPERER